MRYGFIYETTNNLDDRKYIGSHKRSQNLEDPDDSWYLGSGDLFMRALLLYGRENFSRVILQECDSEEELIKAEEYYLNLYNVDENPDYYNLTRKSRTGYPVVKGSKLPDYWKDSMSKSAIERVNRGEYINPAKLPGVGDKISKSLKEGYATGRICKKIRGREFF